MLTKPKKKQVSTIGLGLIGGSLAMALKDVGFKSVIGISASNKTEQTAKDRGIIDQVASSVAKAVKDSDLVFICTPIAAIESVFRQIAPRLKEGCIVTDVASTKEGVVKLAEKILPTTVSFIGGHPMAGKEKSGIEHAEKELFKDCTWCLVPTSLTSNESLVQLKEILVLLAAKPIILDAATHDKAVASISHLPFLLSAILVNTVSSQPYWDTAAKLAASGFKDVSRLAGGNVRMHTEICQTNRVNILAILDEFLRVADELKQILKSNDQRQLSDCIEKAKRERDKLYSLAENS